MVAVFHYTTPPIFWIPLMHRTLYYFIDIGIFIGGGQRLARADIKSVGFYSDTRMPKCHVGTCYANERTERRVTERSLSLSVRGCCRREEEEEVWRRRRKRNRIVSLVVAIRLSEHSTRAFSFSLLLRLVSSSSARLLHVRALVECLDFSTNPRIDSPSSGRKPPPGRARAPFKRRQLVSH